jgi:amino acid adenylation domain-containing protein/non-ribosomal peptide synthase protein (TIGR01720 family)
MSTLEERVRGLSPAKRALWEQWLRAEAASTAAACAIGPRSGTAPPPLSFAQQRLWFLDQLEPGDPSYNVAAAARIAGPLDADLLERSLQAVIARHESLRTTFPAVDGQPRQWIQPVLDWRLARVDLSGLPEPQRPERARQLGIEEAQRPFDLSTGPLIRGTLVRLGPDEHVLLLTLHHIVCDGWSMVVLRSETAVFYEAFRRGQNPSLPPPAIQYADYAIWQREQLSGPVLAAQLDYWKSRLGGETPVLELPADRPRPAVASHRGDTLGRKVPRDLRDALVALGRREGNASLFMVLLAAFQVLLGRLSGQSDVRVGSPIANRTLPQLEKLIGFFVNTLVHRADLAGDPTFRELLAQVKDSAMGAFAHQDLPFEKLVEELAPHRDLSRTPLFQTMLVLQNVPQATVSAGDLQITDIDLGNVRSTAFDLTLNVAEGPRGLDLLLVYSTDLFDEPTAARLLDGYLALLQAVAADPGRRISRLPIMSAAERQRQITGWNATCRPELLGHTVEELFSQQAARTPDALAVVCQRQSLTYAELERRANQLAQQLRSLGVREETTVGLCVERSAEMIVGLLGIMKSGGAYVPLDSQYPPARLAFLARDAGASLIVSDPASAESLSPIGARRVLLGGDEAPFDEQAGGPLPNNAPGSLAYVIYTSGSTGEPKGVEVVREALAHHALAMVERLGLDSSDRVLQYLSPSFDASAEEIFPTLIAGATLWIHPRPQELTGREALELVRSQGITVLHIPPPLWHQFVDELESERARGLGAPLPLKAFMTGGDAASPERLARWRDLTGGSKFLFLYGVTEATITNTLYEPAGDSPAPLRRVPIGRPIANTQAYVLDPQLQPVPMGVPGELYLGGAGLARGYRNQPELTAEKFIPHPFDHTPGRRLYRTGDLVRRLPDGNLEFLGRVDHQVKVRGYRIELGEIEAALAAHPDVAEVAVVAREDQPGQKRLVAYIVPRGVSAAASWREFLRARLPEHLLPSAFVELEALPRTSAGKLDRRALPAPDASRPDLQSTYVAPRTPTEAKLAEIWAGVLGIDRVGIHDNFFELGGDSIQSIQMISRAGAAGLHLTPKQLFQHQTIAELAAVASQERAVAAEQGPVTGELVLTPIQRRLFELELADIHHFNQALWLDLAPEVTLDAIERAAQAVMTHHDALRLRFARGPAGWRAWHAPPEQAAAVVVRRQELAAGNASGERQRLEEAVREIQATLNLEHGPVVQWAVLDFGPGVPRRLLIVAHHLVIDAVSWRILLEDLELACRQALAGQRITLPPKTTSYQAWSIELQELARSEAIRSQAEYWLAVSAGARPLPRDRSGGNEFGHERSASVMLSADDTHALLHEVNAAYRTKINDLLLAALVLTTHSWHGGDDLLVDLDAHGRDDGVEAADVSRTVGWFTALYPLRLRLPASGAPGEVIKAVKEQLRQVPTAGLGYGLLRTQTADAELARRLAAAPGADISFNYLGQLDQALPRQSLFRPLPDPPPHHSSPRNRRTHPLEVLALVRDGRLQVKWLYSEQLHQPATMERLAEEYLHHLRRLIEHCRSPQAGGVTPSDFPLAELSNDELRLLEQALAGGEAPAPTHEQRDLPPPPE